MSDLLTHTEGGVLTITFNRLPKKNALTAQMYQQLADTLIEAGSQQEVRVLVFQGHELVYSAGNDLADFLEHPPTSQDAPVFRFLQALHAFPKPVLAAVCGPAVGIGTTMLFHCDLVVAGDNAAFSMPFVNLGLCPEAGASLLAPRMMGYHRAAEALLLGEPFLAEAALEVGLVNRVVPPGEANTVVQAMARKLAGKPMASLLATKHLMKASQHEAVSQTMAQEAAVFARMLGESAARDAFAAFMGKRKPDTSGA